MRFLEGKISKKIQVGSPGISCFRTNVPSSTGQAVVTGAHAGGVERRRESVNTYTLDSGQIALYYSQQMM